VVQPHSRALSFSAARPARRGAVCGFTGLLTVLLLPVIYHFQLQGAAAAAAARSEGEAGGRLSAADRLPGPGHDPFTCPCCQASSADFCLTGAAFTATLDLPARRFGPGYCGLGLALPSRLVAGPRSPPFG